MYNNCSFSSIYILKNILYIFHSTCPNRYEHFMFFERLAISEIIKKISDFFRKTKKLELKNCIFSLSRKRAIFNDFVHGVLKMVT